MRLTHLTEDEIQGFLDLRDMRDKRGLSSEEALVFHEKSEHLDTCSDCREKVHDFEFLFEDLAVSGLCEVKLPKNFARKATLRIPPFAAACARTSVRLWAFVSAVTILLLSWWLVTVNWTMLAGQATLTALPRILTVKSWLTILVSRITFPDLSFVHRWIPTVDLDWTYLYAAAVDVLSNPIAIALAVLAGAVSLAWASAEDIIAAEIFDHHE